VLMSGKHGDKIAEAKGVIEIREALIINEAAFVDIIASGHVQTHPVKEETSPPGTPAAIGE